jgi:hypothetical protein
MSEKSILLQALGGFKPVTVAAGLPTWLARTTGVSIRFGIYG